MGLVLLTRDDGSFVRLVGLGLRAMLVGDLEPQSAINARLEGMNLGEGIHSKDTTVNIQGHE